MDVLERTPGVLFSMLDGLDDEWTSSNEGENTWTAKEVVAHLIICEKTNWLVRTKIILSDATEKSLMPIDMQGHFQLASSNSTHELLTQFAELRDSSIKELSNLNLEEQDFIKTAVHSKLGVVNLQQLIATWVTHDLTHIAQVARVMAKQNAEQVGPFETFLRILKDRQQADNN